ncbi:uncharacterized protein ARMOST_18835 [Armillaria ostoyae]|uniref:Uncharacterized protein n=1 Tax=Armillaria ostoyae TaxID=47428 RepID=A0A284S2V6_ARMOS|nr:uncharacterized protein ARMOST_18835 [Armillaria ostoyae]
MPFPIIQDIGSSRALPEHIVSSSSLGKLVSLALASPLVVFTDVDGESAVHGSSYSLSFCQSFPVMDSCMSYGDERRDVSHLGCWMSHLLLRRLRSEGLVSTPIASQDVFVKPGTIVIRYDCKFVVSGYNSGDGERHSGRFNGGPHICTGLRLDRD